MYPNNDQTPPPPVYTGNSLEYLEQIAPKKPGRFQGLDKKILLVIILAGLIVVSLVVMAAVSNSGGPPSGAVLGARLEALGTLIAYDEADRVGDPNLKKTLSETRIVALSHKYQLSQLVTLSSTDKNKSAEIAAQESVDSVLSSLDAVATTSRLGQQYSAALVAQIYKINEALQDVRSKLDSPAAQIELDAAAAVR
jgi:hypothetical protein